jgi:hypothetical protein
MVATKKVETKADAVLAQLAGNALADRVLLDASGVLATSARLLGAKMRLAEAINDNRPDDAAKALHGIQIALKHIEDAIIAFPVQNIIDGETMLNAVADYRQLAAEDRRVERERPEPFCEFTGPMPTQEGGAANG